MILCNKKLRINTSNNYTHMKKSSLLAFIGVMLFLLNNIFYSIANALHAWETDWYETVGYIWTGVIIVAWILIGQFFITLYKKSK